MAAPRVDISAQSFDVNVKDFRGQAVVIRVDPSWDVSKIKTEIAQQTGVDPKDFRIVFAGQTLADHQTLWDIGVQGYSTLHCIRFRGVDVQMATTLRKVAENMGKMNVDDRENHDPHMPTTPKDAKTHHSCYVFCKKPCGNMAPAKLRVRCARCKDTSFILSGGPGGWDDILIPGRLHGHCNRDGCQGTNAEFFFKCGAHATQEAEECVALPMIRSNTVNVECASCLDTKQLVMVFCCPERHCLCVECFKQYCEVELTSRRFLEKHGVGYTVRCPAGCEGSEVTESHHFRLMGRDLYDRFQRFGTEEFILQAGGVLCPAANCGMGLLPDDMGRRVQCPRAIGGCGFVFCRSCKSAYHEGTCRAFSAPDATAPEGNAGFQVTPENLERARWNQASEHFIGQNTKPCPRCQIPVEKNGGCMHMTCGMAQCRYEWCWICTVEWNRQCQSMHWFG